MLKKALFLFIFILPASLFMQEKRPDVLPLPFLQKEDPEALFDYTVNDSRIEFFAEGSWEAEAAEQITFTFTPDTAPKIELLIPVFSQKVDLSLWFLLNSSWYFEAAFADGFDKNTVAAGYYGDGFIKHARISNRNIRLSQNHALRNIGTGDNQAPGISVQMGKDAWAADAFLRYDAYEQKSKTFSGKNEIDESLMSSEAWVRSIFVLPSEKTAAAVSDIFVEDEDGPYLHQSGKKLAKLNRGAYIVIPSERLLILSKEYDGLILVSITPEISIDETRQRMLQELGTFTTNGFLKTVQDEFISSGSSIDLSAYSYCGSTGESCFTGIESIAEPVLLLQNPPFFSPFTCPRYYETDSSDIDEVHVVLNSSSQKSQKLHADISANSRLYSKITSSKKQLIEVYRVDDPVSNSFPFAPEEPSIYLSHPRSAGLSYSISIRSSTAVSSFDIGTNAVDGTITITKNGIEEKNFTFDKQKGTIIFTQEPKEHDTIVITWKEESKGFEHGFVSFAGGVSYTRNENLLFTGGLSVNYPVSNQGFSVLNTSSPGNISAAAGIQYSAKGFSIQNTVQVNAVHPNPSGFLRIEGMDKESATNYLGEKSVQKVTAGAAPILNPRRMEVLPELMIENQMLNSTLEPVTDADVTSYAFLSSWEVSPAEASGTAWTAIEIDLSTRSQDLQKADLFSIAFKEVSFNSTNDYEIYLQLGNVENTLDKNMYERRIGTWKISKKEGEINPTDVVQSVLTCSSSTAWQTAQVALSDKDRSLIQSRPFARIIFVQHLSPSYPETTSASILTGPYEIIVPQFSASGSGAFTYSSFDSSSLEIDEIKRFNPKGKNTVQNLLWNKTGIEEDERLISYRKRIGIIPLDEYTKAGFFLYVTENSSFSSFTLNLNSSREGLDQTAYSLVIDKSYFQDIENTWISIEIDIDSLSVSLNGEKTDITLAHMNNVLPDTLEITVTTRECDGGLILIDELYAGGIDLRYEIENRFAASYKAEGALVSVKDIPLISDFNAELTSDPSYSFSRNHFSAPLNAEAGVTLNILALSGGISSVYNTSLQNGAAPVTAGITRAFHSASTVPLFIPFTVLSLNEDFTFSPQLHHAQKANSLSLNLSKLRFPFSLKAQTSTSHSMQSGEQKASAETSLLFPFKFFDYALTAKTSLEQKTLQQDTYNTYSAVYTNASSLQFSNASGSLQRKEKAELSQSAGLAFLQLKPSFTISGSNEYTQIKEPFTSSLLALQTDIPFVILRQQFILTHKKELVVKEKTQAGGTYFEDVLYYKENITKSSWFFKQSLFYDLYSPYLFGIMDSENSNNSLFYSSTYSAAWKRPLFLSSLDFFIPSALEAGAARSVISTGSNQGTDLIILTGGLGFTAFNSFGKFSSKQIVSWYEQDELIHSWKGEFRLSKETGQLIDYSISGFEQFTVYITDTNTLQQSLDITLSGKKTFSIKTGLVWNRPRSASPLVSLLILSSPLEKENISLMRNTGIDYSFEKKTDTKHSVLGYHELKTTINTFFSVRAKASASCIFSSSALEKIEIQAVIAAKLLF
jgi:DNA polymerase-4